MKLIGLLVLLALVSLVEGEVVESFATSCPQFFLNQVPPTVLTDQNNPLRYQQICQKYKGEHRYATLYDTSNRIPVYSAYVYQRRTPRPNTKWMIEPQLDLTDPTEMTAFGANQSVDADYRDSSYTRGHVNPSCYNCGDNQISTFTLTNVAPQTQYDNQNWNNEVETPLREKIERECNLENNNLAYVVTGVIPGQTFIKKRSGEVEMNRVNIPSYYWTAFSCLKQNQSSRMSGGYLLEMTMNTTNTGAVRATFHDNMDDLNRRLSELYSTPFTVFGQPTPTAQGFRSRCLSCFSACCGL